MEKKINPIYPNSQFKSFCYIKSVISRPNIIAGDYSYYDDSEDGPESFEKHVTHHYDFMGDKLIIGKFVAIAKVGSHLELWHKRLGHMSQQGLDVLSSLQRVDTKGLKLDFCNECQYGKQMRNS